MSRTSTELEKARAEFEEATMEAKNPPQGFVTEALRERLRRARLSLETLEANTDDRPTPAELRAARAAIEQEAYERKANDRRYRL